MDIDGISSELKAKAMACTSADELAALVEEEGLELSQEQLDALSGGVDWHCSDKSCSDHDPYC